MSRLRPTPALALALAIAGSSGAVFAAEPVDAGPLNQSALSAIYTFVGQPGQAVNVDSNPAAKAFQEAVDKVIAAGENLPGGARPPPDISAPRVRSLLEKSANVAAVLGTPEQARNAARVLIGLCGKSVEATMVYSLAGLYAVEPGSPGHDVAQATHALMNRNLETYQDIVVPLSAFSIQCAARTIPAVLGRTPGDQRKGGGEFMSQGFHKVVLAALAMLRDTDITPRNKLLYLNAVADSAPAMVSLMQPPERDAIRRAVESAMGSAKADAKPYLKAIDTAITSQPSGRPSSVNLHASGEDR
ncbi:hypothetical protein [Luteibacter jiangsuensis]